MALSGNNKLVLEFKEGNKTSLDEVFKDNYQYCVNWLIKKYDCTKADAEDIFMDALLVFRTEVLKGRVSDKNLKGYLVTVSKNIYLQRIRKSSKNPRISLDTAEYAIGKETGLYDEDFDPLLKKETYQAEEEKGINQLSAYKEAWEQLGDQCQKVLKGFYIDKIKLKELQHQLGYSSYDSIKSIRRRCFNQLKSLANGLLG